MNRTEHHTTMSELGFFFHPEDLPIVNAYNGTWVVNNKEDLPNNYWVVTIDGKGHNVHGHLSPQQILDFARTEGWPAAYVAPYGRYVEGEDDGVLLHDWIADGRRKRKHGKPH